MAPEDMPAESRAEVVGAIRRVLSVDAEAAPDLVRAAEPLWDAMERAGGFGDSWGGSEFCWVLPEALAFIRRAAHPPGNALGLERGPLGT